MGIYALVGAFLAACGFMLYSPVQEWVSKITGINQRWLPYISIGALMTLTILAMPFRAQYVFGFLMMGFAAIMIWVIPKKPSIKKWVEDTFFAGNNVLDNSARYAKLVAWCKMPLFAFGLGIIAPITIVWMDAVILLFAIGWFYFTPSVSEKTPNEASNEPETQT